MNYWLMKSEPDTFGVDHLARKPKRTSGWDGVRNFQARSNMKAMRRGDLAFFYHTGEEKAVVGIVKVIAEAHQDSTDPTGQWQCVDVAAVEGLPRPVTLAEVKAHTKLKDMKLARNPRLSVQPVTPQEWAIICKLGGLAKPPEA